MWRGVFGFGFGSGFGGGAAAVMLFMIMFASWPTFLLTMMTMPRQSRANCIVSQGCRSQYCTNMFNDGSKKCHSFVIAVLFKGCGGRWQSVNLG